MRSSNECAIFASVGQSSNPKNESVGQLYPDSSASTPRALTLLTLDATNLAITIVSDITTKRCQ